MSDLEDRINAFNQEKALQNQAEQQRILAEKTAAEKAAKQAERRMKIEAITTQVKNTANTVGTTIAKVVTAPKRAFDNIKANILAERQRKEDIIRAEEELLQQREGIYQDFLAQNEAQTEPIVKTVQRDENGNVLSETISIKTPNGLLIKTSNFDFDKNPSGGGYSRIKHFPLERASYTGFFPNKEGLLVFNQITAEADKVEQYTMGSITDHCVYIDTSYQESYRGIQRDSSGSFEDVSGVLRYTTEEEDFNQTTSSYEEFFQKNLTALHEQGANAVVLDTNTASVQE
ncbi:MAG: hypothetical protein IJB10_04595 [Clostridia bacterium]|nr:hypothetical protein [Clostridia bacterium]